MTEIAVVGIDCRFPGAADTDSFWRLLLDGVVTDAEIPSHRWDSARYYHPAGVAGSMNTRRAHLVDGVDAFDNEFFGIAPVEAAALDPQQRLLLQTSWRALEDAGINPKSLSGSATGVFVGVMSSEWSSRQMFDYAHLSALHGSGSGYFMLANRISYHLNLNGPSMAVDSACSSSLVALHQGCAALRGGEADLVIAAGANLILTPALSVFYTQAGLSAPDGRCKPFCQGADGIGRGEGVAAVVLRRLDDAVADGQPIYAVVKSSVVNHDGRSNGITAPSRPAQVDLMRRALRIADVDADRLDFVEAHGTGTILGDMIEANALGDIHRSRTGEPCLLGSVKGNIGHTEGAAGIASFIKACLALHHRVLPPTVIADQPNPGLRLETQGLRLASSAQQLPADSAFGAVSSFGLGGTNAHVVLGSAPVAAVPITGGAGVLSLSAPNERALRRNAETAAAALGAFGTVGDLGDARLAAWCRATNVVKQSHRHRLVLAGDREALIDGLRGYLAGTRGELASSTPARKGPADVGLLCSGQGTQYPGMTRPLYDASAVYREHLDEACAALDRHGLRTSSVLFGESPDLHDTRLAQPALFAVSYALAKTLLDNGIRPAFGIGHSIGEIATACLAGVLSVQDAATMAVLRGELMASLPPGGAMIAVDVPEYQASALIAGEADCAVAAVNGPRAVVLSGPSDAIERVGAVAREQGALVRNLDVAHGFHSPLMQPIVSEFRRQVAGLDPKDAAFPIFSTVVGKQLAGQEMGADYWAAQICAPVRFFDAIDTATRDVRIRYVAEAGPRTTLLRLARQAGLAPQTRTLALCTGPGSDGVELLTAAAVLLRDGQSVELSGVYGPQLGTAERIPPYTFDTTNSYRFDQPAAVPSKGETSPAPAAAGPAETIVTGTDLPRQVMALIAQIGGYPVDMVELSSRLSEDLGYDSLLQLRLFEQMRRHYPELGLTSITDLTSDIGSVGDLIDLVRRRLADPAR